ncbi:CHAT domain-containing protein [Candidatus Albibeggiatoa sp. nov. NOAA]|uniref:CHAT domain-containing protein n=1 Tax=Candidatus Albibeggiatoa sp. nov. NOAA TaxID=3162724 RepID=UPI0032F2F9B0|nr:CHAT domain-containing protein [Thiotrichaceae bacterium]
MMRYFLSFWILFSSSVFAQSSLEQADQAFERGQYTDAIEQWQQAVEQQTQIEQIQTLSKIATAYQKIGMHREVFQVLQQAYELAEKIEDKALQVNLVIQLSDAWLTIGDAAEALKLVQISEKVARDMKDPELLAKVLNNSGNVYAVYESYFDAVDLYSEALGLLKTVDNPELEAKILLNQVKAMIEVSPTNEVLNTFQQAWAALQNLEPNQHQFHSLIAIAMHARGFANDPELTLEQLKQVLAISGNAFQTALKLANQLKQSRLQSIAYGRFAQLYVDQGQIESAQQLNRQALFFAKQNDMPDLLYLWQWQQGVLLDLEGKLDQAIAAYRRATDTLQPIQYNLDVGLRTNTTTFNELVRPVYYELAGLLLKKADLAPTEQEKQDLLLKARDMVEHLKVAELQNYFQEECVANLQDRTRSIDEVMDNTAILYPIPLADRLSLLISTEGKIHLVNVDATKDDIDAEALNLRILLQTRPNNRFLYPAQKLYNWLIRPIESILQEHDIDTLVVVPDGRLRMIPLTTLHDGEKFLIEKVAMAITPGLNLVDPHSIDWQNSDVLLVGLSDAVQDYPPLPSVVKELHTIKDITGSDSLIINKDYSIESFRNALQSKEYSVIHLATHGEFSSDPEHTYLLTYEDKLTMNKLQDVIGLGKFRDKPVELLTLSACRTAVGDEKAALGLAGVAVKAGARSAIATLWFVDDEATALAIMHFYRLLNTESGLTKAKALQKVQKKLISQDRYWHPSYWGPFLLIGNWL